MPPETNLKPLSKINPNKDINRNAIVTKAKHRNLLEKIFGSKIPKPALDLEKDLRDVNAMFDILDNPIRSKRAEANDFKKTTMPIIMDPTANSNSKKHHAYVKLQPKSTTTSSSPELSKERSKLHKFLNKFLHKKQKQKRDVLTEVHREMRSNPLKRLKSIFQASGTPKQTTKLTMSDFLLTFENVLTSKTPNAAEIEKKYGDPLYKMAKVGYEAKITPLFNEYFEEQIDQPKKGDPEIEFTTDKLLGKYHTYKYDPIYLKMEDYLTAEPNPELNSHINNKFNKPAFETTDILKGNEFTFGFKFDPLKYIPTFKIHKPTTNADHNDHLAAGSGPDTNSNTKILSNAQFDRTKTGKKSKIDEMKFRPNAKSPNQMKINPSPKLDQVKIEPSAKYNQMKLQSNAKFDQIKMELKEKIDEMKLEPNAKFDLIEKDFGQFDSSPKYDNTNQYDTDVNIEEGNLDHYEPREPGNPLYNPPWTPTDINELQKILDEKQAHNVEGKLIFKLLFIYSLFAGHGVAKVSYKIIYG